MPTSRLRRTVRRLDVEPLEDRVTPTPLLHATDAAGRLFTVDAANGAVTVVGTTSVPMTDIAFSPDGRLYGIDTANDLYKIDPATAATTLVGPVGYPVNALAIAPFGGLYAAGDGLYYFPFIDLGSGAGFLLGSLGANASAGDLAFDANGTAYVSTVGNDLVSVNLSNGATTLIGPIGFSSVQGLAFGPDKVMYGLSGATSQVFTINLTTGAGTLTSSFAGQGVAAVTGASFFGEHLAPDAEPNGTVGQAVPLTGPVDVLRGRIATVTDTDYYRIDLRQGDTWKVGTGTADENGRPSLAPTLEILAANGAVLAAAPDSHTLVLTVPADGTYYLRLTPANTFGDFTGTYSIRSTVEAFGGTTEAEPNETDEIATPLPGSATFRGSLTAGDADYDSVTATAGQAIAVGYAAGPAANPATRLFAPDGTLLAADRTGAGLHFVVPESTTYFIAVRPDNAAGAVTGQYVGQLLLADRPVEEVEPAGGFDGAPRIDFGPSVVSATYLSPTPAFTTQGLTGSYVNASLRGYAPQDDWRVTQTIAGTRTDPVVAFGGDGFGVRSEVGLTKGTDDNWDDFSVQWDGYVVIPVDGVRLWARSDDGSRMWIDINHSGVFGSVGPEFIDNNWGSGQGLTTGAASVPLAAGTYRIRIQYEDEVGANRAFLSWDYAGTEPTIGGARHGLSVADVSVQPNTAVTAAPTGLVVTFNGAADPATLTAASFTVLYSPDERFFDGQRHAAGRRGRGDRLRSGPAHGDVRARGVAPGVLPAPPRRRPGRDRHAGRPRPGRRLPRRQHRRVRPARRLAGHPVRRHPARRRLPGVLPDRHPAGLDDRPDGRQRRVRRRGHGDGRGSFELRHSERDGATDRGRREPADGDARQRGRHVQRRRIRGRRPRARGQLRRRGELPPDRRDGNADGDARGPHGDRHGPDEGLRGRPSGTPLHGRRAVERRHARRRAVRGAGDRRDRRSSVGSYTITRGTLALRTGNYTFTFAPGTLWVTPAPLTIIVRDATRPAGAPPPTFGAIFSGLVNGDTPVVVANLNLTTTATAASPAGTYPITSATAPTAANYDVTVLPGVLTVTDTGTSPPPPPPLPPPPPPPPLPPPPSAVGPYFAVSGSADGAARPYSAATYQPTGATLAAFPGFAGEVRVATGDFNGDGLADFIVTGDNLLLTGNRVTVFSGADLIAGRVPGFGATPVADFDVTGLDWAALVTVAAVDPDGDGRADLAVGSGAGQSSYVKVFRGADLSGDAEHPLFEFDPFGTVTPHGVFVG